MLGIFVFLTLLRGAKWILTVTVPKHNYFVISRFGIKQYYNIHILQIPAFILSNFDVISNLHGLQIYGQSLQLQTLVVQRSLFRGCVHLVLNLQLEGEWSLFIFVTATQGRITVLNIWIETESKDFKYLFTPRKFN